jgi:hypothetical protein
MTKGRSIRLFLADGSPGGIITAEIMNWTGHVMTAPRSRLADLIQRPEAGRTGIYILSGTDPEGGYKPLVYVGETDSVGKRLAQHNKDDAKEFWEQTCVVTSKDQNLTKAHVRYLESRLIQIATEAGRAKLVNNTTPDVPMLPEADQADMEFFIDQLRVVLPVLGLEVLKEAATAKPVAAPVPSLGSDVAPDFPIFELVSKKHDLKAEAREIDGEFVVLAGSQAQASWIGVPIATYQPMYERLTAEGILVPDNSGHLRFVRDYAFTKPSAAAAIVLGRASNGRTEWCVKGTKKTYADWQEAQIAAVATSQEGEE